MNRLQRQLERIVKKAKFFEEDSEVNEDHELALIDKCLEESLDECSEDIIDELFTDKEE
jgi:hypothetical protein